jgi:tripartite-type tricarboxylate transporter receptor subunit TctC
MVASLGVLINSVLPTATYNMNSDFVGVAYLGSVQAAAMTSNRSGLTTAQKLISSKQTVFFGSSGMNSATHISGEILKQNTGMSAEHVPYKGEAAAMSDLLAGNIQLLIGSTGLAHPYYNTDKINVVAVSGNKRNPDMPAVPTFTELGIKGFEVTPNWEVLLANKNADIKIISDVRTALATALRSAEDAELFKQVGLDTNRKQLYNTREFIASEEVRMKKLLQKINLDN